MYQSISKFICIRRTVSQVNLNFSHFDPDLQLWYQNNANYMCDRCFLISRVLLCETDGAVVHKSILGLSSTNLSFLFLISLTSWKSTILFDPTTIMTSIFFLSSIDFYPKKNNFFYFHSLVSNQNHIQHQSCIYWGGELALTGGEFDRAGARGFSQTAENGLFLILHHM